MDSEAALHFVDQLLSENNRSCLNANHAYVFQGIWNGETYKEMARGYEVATIKNYGYALCKRIRKELGINVNKSSIRKEIKKLYLLRQQSSRFMESNTNQGFCAPHISTYLSSQKSKRDDYKYANNLLLAAGDISSREQMQLVLTALEIYKKYNDGEAVSALLCKPQRAANNRQDTIGKKAYRLGFATHTSSLIRWLMESYKAQDYINLADVAKLCNIGGDSVWMSGGDSKISILFHEKALGVALREVAVESLVIDSIINKSLCHLSDRDLENAEICLNQAVVYVSSVSDSKYSQRLLIVVECLLAYLKVLQGRKEAEELLQAAYFQLSDSKSIELLNNWEKHNLPVYVGKSLHMIGRYSDAFQMYMQAKRLAISNEYIQVEFQILMNTAYLGWVANKGNWTSRAMKSIWKAYASLKSIGANKDAAQAQIFLSTIYNSLGQVEQSQALLDSAESVYVESGAILQVERINCLREGNIECF